MSAEGTHRVVVSDNNHGGGHQELPAKSRFRQKRTLIKNACTACQRRKSRCEGQRPICARCEAKHINCEYNTEEGESRWSALVRENRVLRRERDEARELLSLIRSMPESAPQQVYRRILQNPGDDVDTAIHNILESTDASMPSARSSPLYQCQQQQILNYHSYGLTSTAPTIQLPPIQSVVNMPPMNGRRINISLVNLINPAAPTTPEHATLNPSPSLIPGLRHCSPPNHCEQF